MRRQSKRSSMVVSSPSFYSVQDTLPQPNPSVARVDPQTQSQTQTAQSQSTSSVDLTASEASGPHVVASRSHSPSASIALSPVSPPGRAKTTTRRTKYHLPSDWITPPRVSPEELQQQLQQQLQQGQGRQDDVWYSQMREDAPPRFTPSSMSNPSRRSTYSPIIFASSTNNPNAVHEITIAHSRSQSRNTTPSVIFGGNLSRGPSRLGGLFGGNSNSERERRTSSSPSSWFLQKDEEKMGMRFQVQGFTWDGRFVLDSEDGVSGSLRWAKTSSDEERDYQCTDESSDKSDGVEDEIEGVPSYLRRQSTERESLVIVQSYSRHCSTQLPPFTFPIACRLCLLIIQIDVDVSWTLETDPTYTDTFRAVLADRHLSTLPLHYPNHRFDLVLA
ncbi:hypothetical protein NLI96_g7935 [Meripilus lineatus]|uniref:Uncharacterized protein n=1 Tax=Meripilus lineatus TaxID=2056292 RepID=A0AAD5V058_9APHY|nr:hypothetical protein NLI96_g7935 [Physisporinus lineatus]